MGKDPQSDAIKEYLEAVFRSGVEEFREYLYLQSLSPEFSAESRVTAGERLGSGGIPTAPPIPRKTEGRINVKGAD